MEIYVYTFDFRNEWNYLERLNIWIVTLCKRAFVIISSCHFFCFSILSYLCRIFQTDAKKCTRP